MSTEETRTKIVNALDDIQEYQNDLILFQPHECDEDLQEEISYRLELFTDLASQSKESAKL